MSKVMLQTEALEVRRGERVLCRNLDVTLRAGEVWGLLGENGSGKTSLLHTLAGLMPATAGIVQLQQKAIACWRRKTLARHLGLLPQQRQELFPVSVEDAVMAGRYPHRSFWQSFTQDDLVRTAKALETVAMEGRRNQRLQELSGGEQQRIAIATLLAQDPDVLLLDEPCNHLDVRHQVRLMDHFEKLAGQGKALLMALHDVNLASRYCTHLILLFPDGQTLTGEAAELLTESNLSRLFSHPIQEVCDGRNQFWVPV